MPGIADVLVSAALMVTTIDAVKSEPNLEKRSEKALQYADQTLGKLREHYREGKWKDVEAGLEQIRSAVDLARTSLTESGKNARKSPKYFKKAELKTRELARRLETFSQDVSFEERPAVQQLREHVLKVHDQFLDDIMSGRK